MDTKCKCECSVAPKLIFACSGASDVGEIADRAARKLMRDGIGKMFCIAGIGGRVSGIMKTTEAAQAILAIDGCPLNCARKCLEEAGFTEIKHLQLTDFGMAKGKTEISENNIEKAVECGKKKLACQ
ncbi:MAG: putative zinc-binding protein [Victivallaceae bacterium]|nr:putative zinc-binding protein [Victivallaceae bacterium]